jgi:tRNA (mo5U34)-methyltransferase
LLYHVGVLYHLRNPVDHLLALARSTAEVVMLDTHVATPASADRIYQAAGGSFRYQLYREGSRADAFAGMCDHARWLLLEDIEQVLRMAGFGRVEIAEQRQERNGPRALVCARR